MINQPTANTKVIKLLHQQHDCCGMPMADTQCCSFPLALLPSIAPPPLSLMLLLLLTLVPRIPWRLLRTTLASAAATSWLATAAALNCCLAPPFEVLRKV
jgi:hypothetical protein